MWPITPRSEERSSRPPSGLRRGNLTPSYSGISTNGSSGARSLSSIGLKSLAVENDDDDSSCDDTYVSMTSSRGTIVQDDSQSKVYSTSSQGSMSRSPSETGRSSGTLRETTRVSNNSTPKSSLFKSSKKTHHEDSSTTGILDKLKNDISSLEMLKSQTDEVFPEKFSENEFSRLRLSNRISIGSVYDKNRNNSSPMTKSNCNESIFDSSRLESSSRTEADGVESDYDNDRCSTTKAKGNGKYISPRHPDRSRSVDRFRSDANLRETLRGGTTVTEEGGDLSGGGISCQNKNMKDKASCLPLDSSTGKMKRERTTTKPPTAGSGNHSVDGSGSPWREKILKEKVWEKNVENDDLMNKLKVLEREKERLQELVRALKEESAKTIEEKNDKLTMISGIKEQLEQSQSQEAKLERALRELIVNVESEQETMLDELSIAHKLHQSEVVLLEEKLTSSSEENAEKAVIIRELESETKGVQRSLQREKEETEQQLRKKIDELEKEMEHVQRSLQQDKEEIECQLSKKVEDMEQMQSSLKKAKEETEQELSKYIERLQLSMNTSESSWAEDITKLNVELDGSKSAYSKLEGEKRVISEQLNNAESKTRSLLDSIEKNKQEGDAAALRAKKTLQEAREENNTLAEKLDSAIRESHVLSKTTDKNNETINTLERSLADAAEKTKLLAEKLSKADTEHISLKKTIDGCDEEKKKLELTISEAIASKANVEAQLNNVSAALENERQKLANEKEDAMLNANRLERTISFIEEEKRQQTIRIKELTSTISESKSTHCEIEAALTSSMNASKTKLANCMTEIETLKGRIQGKDKQLLDMNETTEAMHKAFHDLKSELKIYQEKKVPSYEANIAKLKANLGESETKVVSLKAELKSVHEDLRLSKGSRLELKKGIEAQASGAQAKETKLNETIQALHSQLDKAKMNIAKSQKESSARKTELKTALQSLDEMMKYIENMREENDDIVASLEADLEKAILMKCDAEKAMQRRLEQAEKEHKEHCAAQDEQKRKLVKDIEACRVDALKQVAKSKDGFAESMREMRKTYEIERGRKISDHESEVESLMIELRKAQEYKTGISQLELSLHKRSSQVQSLTLQLKKIQEQSKIDCEELEESLHKRSSQVESLTLQIKKLQEQSLHDRNTKHELDASLREQSSQCKSLELQLKKLHDQTIDNDNVKHDLESSLQKYSDKVKSLTIKLQEQSINKGELKNELESSLQESSYQVESLTLELNTLREHSITWEKDKKTLESSLQESRAQVESLTSELKKQCQKSDNEETTKHELEASLQDRSSKLRHVMFEMKKLRDHSSADGKIKDELNISLQKSSAQVESLRLDLKKLRLQSEKDESIKGELETSLQEKSAECDEKSSEANILRETVKNLESKIDLLKQKKDEEANQAKLRYLALNKENSGLAEELKGTEREYAALKESMENANSTATAAYDELAARLEKKMKSEKTIRGEMAQKKQMINILQSNEKHLEEHVASLENQINTLVADYESKLKADHLMVCE